VVRRELLDSSPVVKVAVDDIARVVVDAASEEVKSFETSLNVLGGDDELRSGGEAHFSTCMDSGPISEGRVAHLEGRAPLLVSGRDGGVKRLR